MHTRTAHLPGGVLYLVFLLSTAAFFQHEIDGWMRLVLSFVAAGFCLGWAVDAGVWCNWLTAAGAAVLTANLNRARSQARLRK